MTGLALLVAAAFAATGAAVGPAAGTGAPPPLTLGVEGRANSTPSVAARGRLVVLVWTARTESVTDVFSSVSADGGRTFLPPVRVNDLSGDAAVYGEQPPRVAIAAPEAPSGDGAGTPVIYVTWTSKHDGESGVRVARSVDGGRSFLRAATLNGGGGAGSRGWESIAAAPDGSAHTVWLDAMPDAGGHDAAPAAPMAAGPHHEHQAGGKAVVHAQWPSDGSAAVRIADGACECCKTATAVAGDGTIFVAWRHVYPGPTRDIAMAVSRDGGRSFSAPARVSVDGWKLDACPDDGPALAIDGAGVVHIVWPTLVDGASPAIRLFHSTTRDGLTFSPREPIVTLGSQHPAHPQLSSDGEGGVVLAWDEVSAGVRRVAVSRAPSGPAPRFAAPLVVSDTLRPAVYPVLAPSDGAMLVAWTSGPSTGSRIAVGRVEGSTAPTPVPTAGRAPVLQPAKIDDPATRELCASVSQVELPAADRPTPSERAALAGCVSADLYFGFGRPADPVRARKCAYLEMEASGGEPVFGGRTMLMMAYANGKGVARNYNAAIKLACAVGGAPQDIAGRVHQLDRLRSARWTGDGFSVCDHSSGHLLYGQCADLQERFDSLARETRLAAFTARWNARERSAFGTLRQAADRFFQAHAARESNLDATFEVQERAAVEEALVASIERFEQGDRPSASAADLREAEDELNARLSGTQQDRSRTWGTVTPDGVRDAQAAWTAYRDAWLAFAKVRYPAVSAAAWKTWLARERTATLSAFSLPGK